MTESFDYLFDVAHNDALQIMKIEEDKHFLMAQREKGRRGAMAGVDISLKKIEEAQINKKAHQLHLKNKHKIEMSAFDQIVLMESSGSSSSEDGALI